MATRPRAEIDITARNRVQRAIDQAQTQLRGLDRTARLLTGAFSGVAAVQLGRQFVEMADRAKTVENRLKLVTESSTELAQVQSDLFRLAQSSNASFEGTVELYARLARATSELGISQSRLLSVTETINQAIAVSGASSQEAQAALIQLSQGLAAGALRGEELNSVMEQTPRLAQAIAAGMGVTIGQLREMGKAGELTAEAVIRALESQADTISREYRHMETTVGQAVERLSNSMLRLVGSIDNATGSSRTLARAIELVSRALDELTTESSNANHVFEVTLTKSLEHTLRAMGPLGTAAWILAQAIEASGDEADEAATKLGTLAQAQAEHLRLLEAQLTLRRDAARERADALDAQLMPIGDIGVARREPLRNLPKFDPRVGDVAARAEEEQRRREQLEQQLEQIREFTLTREQIELEAHARRLETLRSAYEMELIDKQRFDELSIQAAQRTQERITEIQLAEERKRGQSSRQLMLAQVQNALQGFAMLAQVSDSGSKKLFLVHRALALASAIVSTKKAVAEALATPPVPNVPLAKLTAALGYAQVAAIAATSFGAGAGGGGGGAALAGGGAAAAPTPPPLPRIPDRSEARDAVHIEVNLGNATIVGPGGAEQFAETLVEILRDRVSNRDEVIISANSRQAAELRGT